MNNMKRKFLIKKYHMAEKFTKYYMEKLRKWTKVSYDCCSELKLEQEKETR